jgi:hypothetical protein
MYEAPRSLFTLHKISCRIGPRLCRTSKNSIQARFEESPFHEFRRCGSEQHTSEDRKRKPRIFELSRRFDTPLRMALKKPRYLCRSHPRYLQHLKAALKVLVADERTLDGPEDLTGKTTAQNRLLYASRSGRLDLLYQSGGLNS